MRRTPKRQRKLLVSVDKIRPLDPDRLRDILGGACPKSKPVVSTN